ncbi:MAG: DUF1003 domain-containing protein [Ktedonobacterales bacterium]
MGQVTPLYQRLEAVYDRLAKINHSRHHIYTPATFGTRAADIITTFVGSWLFVGMHAFWFIAWIAFHPEPFPFGLLTLLVSLEAIFLSTFVMMSQNRQAEKDHLRDDHEAEEVDLLFKINQTQLEILQILRTQLCPDPGVGGAAPNNSRATLPPQTPAVQAQRAATIPTPAGSGQSRAKRRR